ncbi:hypothetical protein [Glutamicibacter sp. V16R2B1]|uniref:hypothetical protein n=1 Tax=Glutamicibacter sp. V16R2B1 TaxID=2036207 RepID=UPI0010FE16B2|nr:hypothetical protein [Glutamicibacter sp. V16R2B1]MCK9901304.1 hypothetical protein [Frankia sp. Cpl3]TLK47993.1 hypothetical protein FDN03_15515 [Glutamicibacter sp. V16R2B1]
MSRAAERIAQLDQDAEREAREDLMLFAVAEVLAEHVPWRQAIGPARQVIQSRAIRHDVGAEKLSAEHVENLLACTLDQSVARACAPIIAQFL